MKNRIQQLMKSKEMTQQEFSRTTGISAASLSSIFNGRTAPTMKHAEALHRTFPALNMSWLLFDEGDMYQSATDTTDDVSDVESPLAPDGSQPTYSPSDASRPPYAPTDGTHPYNPTATAGAPVDPMHTAPTSRAQGQFFDPAVPATSHPSGSAYAPRSEEYAPYAGQVTAPQSSHLNDPSRGYVPHVDDPSQHISQGASPAVAPNRGMAGGTSYAPTGVSGTASAVAMNEMVNFTDRKRRKIVEIRIFFDDGTFETFKGNE